MSLSGWLSSERIRSFAAWPPPTMTARRSMTPLRRPSGGSNRRRRRVRERGRQRPTGTRTRKRRGSRGFADLQTGTAPDQRLRRPASRRRSGGACSGLRSAAGSPDSRRQVAGSRSSVRSRRAGCRRYTNQSFRARCDIKHKDGVADRKQAAQFKQPKQADDHRRGIGIRPELLRNTPGQRVEFLASLAPQPVRQRRSSGSRKSSCASASVSKVSGLSIWFMLVSAIALDRR